MRQKSIEKQERKGLPRRIFLQSALYASAGFWIAGSGAAVALPELGEDDPVATALGYTHFSDNEEKTCANCGLYQGDPGKEWGECSIFPKRVVSAAGWCNSWIASSN